MNQFVLWIQIVVALSIVDSISLVRRRLLCDKSFGTCSSFIVEIFWIFLEDCTKELE